MGAEKIVKINSEHEVEYLKERINLLESVIDYSLAETVQGLKNNVKNLENEAIALRAADAEKDKMITEKNNQIAEIKKNFNNQLESKLQWQRRQFEAEKTQSLSDQRKNIRSKEVKPEKEKVEQAKQEVDRIQKMYESLLDEFSQVKNTLETHTSLLYQIIDIVSNSSSIEEAKDEIEEVITETKTALGISFNDSRKPSKADKIAFTKLVNNLRENGLTNKEIAEKLYNEGHPFMISCSNSNAREQKIGRYLNKKY